MPRKNLGLLVLLSCPIVGACSNETGVFVSFSQRELVMDEPLEASSGCMGVAASNGDSGSSSSGTVGAVVQGPDGQLRVDDDLIVEQMTDEDLPYEMTVKSAGMVLARRRFTRMFLTTGRLDRFDVTTHAGRHYEFAHRGSLECEVVDLFHED